jgi:para-nitrobenzyl esterase
MVWIHGGGNTIGTASFYDGSELAARHDMLVVMVNYRLGPIGWLRHAALREGASPAEQSGNFGNLDHLAALVWVQENIAAFGGDPGNVTIFGESAGGHDVLALLVSPLSRGLFHRAIVQSGGTSRSTVAEAENFRDAPDPGDPYSSNEILVRLLLRDGLASDRAQAKTRLAALSADEIAARLRRLEAAELYALYVEDTAEPGLGMIDHPRIFGDGVVLPAADFHDTLAAGHYGRMPVMLGSNRDENKLFLFSDPAHVRKLFGVLPRLRDAQRYERVASALSRTWKANSVDELAWRMQKVQGASVFAYRFDWDEEPQVFGSDLSQMLGAAHAFEIPFVFGHWDLGPEGEMLFDEENAPGRVALSDAMMSYWSEFAYSGDPGRGRDGSLPTWSAWGAAPGQEKYIVFDTAPDGGVRMASETVTLAEIAAELAGDTHGDAAERCALRTQLTLWWPRLEVELAESEEAAAIRVACAGTSGAGAGGE